MADKFIISMWNYKTVYESRIEEVDWWADCGINAPQSPTVNWDDSKGLGILTDFLDRARERGIKIIVNVLGLRDSDLKKIGEKEYTERFIKAYSVLNHPALFGFFVGDEPDDVTLPYSLSCVKIQKRIAPELSPYLNFHAQFHNDGEKYFGKKSFDEWMKDFAGETGVELFSYGNYEQAAGRITSDSCMEASFSNLRPLVEASEAAGMDCVNTQLSSAHVSYRIQSEYDFTWQITVPAACGSRGVSWFRFYDRLNIINYHGSPIDEFGNKTEYYYRMLRANRRFSAHFGEIIVNLKRTATYFNEKSFGGYDLFNEKSHDVIKSVFTGGVNVIVSFFADDQSREYLCLVNADFIIPAQVRIGYDSLSYSLYEILQNGRVENEYNDSYGDGLWLYPGQMALLRIDGKQ